jgi:general nucleoside transport system permease protein
MIHLIIKIATPLLLAATGGLAGGIAGTLNIGLEGLMLAGAFAAIAAAGATGSTAVAIVVAAATGALLASVFVVFTLRFEANVFITGLALNLLAFGLTAVLSSILFSTQGVVRPAASFTLATYHLPVIDTIPVIGEIVSDHSVFVPLSWAVAIAFGIVLSKTRFGLELIATGIDADVVRIRGGNPVKCRAVAALFSGVAAALAGAALSLDLEAFVPNMSAGRGWIALVIVLLARKRVWGVVVASLLFASAEYGANALQGEMRLPKTIALAIPYLVTLASMIVFAIPSFRQSRSKSK